MDDDDARASKRHKSKSHKKDKKQHKDKKSKKVKKSKRRASTSSSSSGSEDGGDQEVQWVEKSTATAPPEKPALQRDAWMLGGQSLSSSTAAADGDEFANVFGLTNAPPPPPTKADLRRDEMEEARKRMAARELNPFFKNGGSGLPPTETLSPAGSSSVGTPMSQVMLRKLQRVFEIAAEESRPIDDVAVERFGSIEAFNAAVAERDRREAASGANTPRSDAEAAPRTEQDGMASSSYLSFANSATLARARFSRPDSGASTPQAHGDSAIERGPPRSLIAKASTESIVVHAGEPTKSDAATSKNVVVIPTLDLRGHATEAMAGGLAKSEDSSASHGRKRKDRQVVAEQEKLEKEMTIEEMVRREKLGVDSNLDDMLARRMTADGGFQDNLDYMDDNSDRLASTHRSQDKKRKVAIEDFARQQKALAKCNMCYRDDNKPAYPVIALGIKTYLALMPYESVATCMIVPIEHTISTLDEDDAFWDEVRNFMKCLIRMYDAQGKDVLFMETVPSMKWQRHTAIEVLPVSQEIKADAPAYFREALMSADEEWTQHAKIIDTQKRGFRNSMVPELPYFHVWFTLDGGYGHIIEEREKFSDWFGKETLGQIMDASPALYRKQRWLDRHTNHQRLRQFLSDFEPYDWTKMLEGGAYVEP
ncbi:Pre-mRNA-splicing factor cwf19 [Sorochytrium milnesiophthora]